MTDKILLPPKKTPPRKYLRPWKIIGLGIYVFSLIFYKMLPGFIVTIGHLCGTIVIINLLYFVARYLKDRFFWRVRNRLFGSFIFTGFIPLLILIGVIALSVYLLFGQLAGQYLDNALKENKRLISGITTEFIITITPADASLLKIKAPQIFLKHSDQFPQLAVRLLRRQPGGNIEEISKYDPQVILPEISPHPGDKWLDGTSHYEGFLYEGESLFLTSFQSFPESGLYIETTALLDISFINRLIREKSIYAVFYGNDAVKISLNGRSIAIIPPSQKDLKIDKKNKLLEQTDVVEARRKEDSRGMLYWMTTLRGKRYTSGENTFVGAVRFCIPRIVIADSLNPENFQNMMALGLLTILAFFSVLAVLISMFIGFIISRQITGSVHDMYQGILALQKGNLQFRMPVRRNDQLGLLAHSFNQMSASISHLLDEVGEKKKLERDLEIAREVQAALFPKQLPHPPGMALFGGCKPARTVSGDYYDFIVVDETHLFIIVGDISGKGIPAALLMANLQATMRNQLNSIKNNDPETIEKSLAEVMTKINQQVYLNSPPEKFITLFLSLYDAGARRLWYCNAAHPPPIVLNGHGPQSLDVTGMAVGMFPDVIYQSKFIDLTPGMLLAIFTDGATEAMNKDDEEFGNIRLGDALQEACARAPEEIWELAISRIDQWQGDLPQNDDITLIVSKIG
jgi:phosphoserine phosphatase RsbU/P